MIETRALPQSEHINRVPGVIAAEIYLAQKKKREWILTFGAGCFLGAVMGLAICTVVEAWMSDRIEAQLAEGW